ncbi:MAG: proteasome accessory factor PafA2 family protein, partial [Chthoniobacteraceae bacterium]
ALSRDESCRWMLRLRDGHSISALDVQREYLQAALRLDSDDEDATWTLREWERALKDLAADYWRCADRIDWVAKKQMLSLFREEQKLEWSDPWLQSIDLEYHNVSPEDGLAFELEKEERLERLVSEKAIKEAIFQPPMTTRAFFRGRAVARFDRDIESIQWDEIVFRHHGSTHTVGMDHPAGHPEISQLNSAIQDQPTLGEVLAALGKM